jgi:hypothetical protein
VFSIPSARVADTRRTTPYRIKIHGRSYLFFFLAFQSFSELKTQASFSDLLLSVYLFVCKLFTFSISLEPLAQFQPNLAQIFLG